METKYLQRYAKSFIASTIFAISGYAADNNQILIENSWNNIGYSNAKDAMLSGATTATSKGYSSLFVNPAGLYSNYAVGIYAHTADQIHKNPSGDGTDQLTTTSESLMADNLAVGLFYKYLVFESKPKIHNAVGLAYGLQTNYGLFSLGGNYVKDATTVDNYLKYGTGDYYTAGFQWQKSFIGIEDFYALYLGYSQKGQGVNQIEGEQLAMVSPIIKRIGIGAETNIFSSSLLLTYDISTQSWTHLEDKVDTHAVGLKWMIWNGFSLGLGASNSVYTTDLNYDTGTTLSAGIEFSLWKMNIAAAVLQKEVLNTAGDVYMKDENIHADISFAF